MYCVGAPATHYFPVSIAYHGCVLNITVQSYLDQLDFGLVACSETLPDAQRIADYIVEDFAAMRKARRRPDPGEAIETIAVARPAPVAAHKPIEVGEAKAEPRARKEEKVSALTQSIDALGEATEALRRRLEKAQPAAPAKTRAAKAKAATPRERAASKPAPRTSTPSGISDAWSTGTPKPLQEQSGEKVLARSVRGEDDRSRLFEIGRNFGPATGGY